MTHSYESADAFSVAFKRLYNISPLAARQKNVELQPFYRLYFDLLVKYIKGGTTVKSIINLIANINEVEIFEMPTTMLVGREIRTLGDVAILGSDEDFGQLPAGLKGNRVPELWQASIKDGSLDVIMKLPSLIPNVLIGWTGDFSENNSASYVVGAFVPFDTPIPLGYACRISPATLKRYLRNGISGSNGSI